MAPQIPRLALVFGTIVIAFVVVRSMVVPESFGEYGFYRGDFPRELQELPMVHAGHEACLGCHADKEDTTNHFLYGVNCESCHGPALDHVESFDEFTPFTPTTRADCGRCHFSVAGRRDSFPQQEQSEHYPDTRCSDCHTIHDWPEEDEYGEEQ